MPRATLRAAVEWIAHNDNSGNGDSEREISEYVTTLLVADLFGIEPEKVAAKIARVRRANDLEVRESCPHGAPDGVLCLDCHPDAWAGVVDSPQEALNVLHADGYPPVNPDDASQDRKAAWHGGYAF